MRVKSLDKVNNLVSLKGMILRLTLSSYKNTIIMSKSNDLKLNACFIFHYLFKLIVQRLIALEIKDNIKNILPTIAFKILKLKMISPFQNLTILQI